MFNIFYENSCNLLVILFELFYGEIGLKQVCALSVPPPPPPPDHSLAIRLNRLVKLGSEAKNFVGCVALVPYKYWLENVNNSDKSLVKRPLLMFEIQIDATDNTV